MDQKNPKAITLIDTDGTKRDITGLKDANYTPFHGTSGFTGEEARTIIAISDDNGNVIGIGTSGSIDSNIALAATNTDMDAMMLAWAKKRNCTIKGPDGKTIN